MRHLNACMGIFLLMALLFIPQVCAWTSSEFTLDNAKQLEKNSLTTYGKYEITEHQWWDILKVFTEEKVKEVILEENTDECSDNCFAIKEVTNLKPMPLIDDVRFYREIDGKWILWNGFTNWRIEVEEDVDLFETNCIQGKEIIDEKNGTSYFEQDCSQVKIGTEKRWLPLDYKKDYEGTYRVKLSGGKKASVKYDWQIKMNGVWSEDWAIWGAVIGMGGVEASVTLNSPADDSTQYTNPVTLNASANVTGGAYLVNATLYDNSTGSWGARDTTDFNIGGDGLVSYYKLDETSGTTAIDSMNKNNGTNTGSIPINQAGKIGTAYKFDGTNRYIAYNTKLLNTQTTTTFNVWVYNNWTINGKLHGIYEERTASGGSGYDIQYNSNGSCQMALVTSNIAMDLTSPFNCSSGWFMATWVRNGNVYTMYVNGTSRGTVTRSDTAWGSQNGQIGTRTSGGDEYVNGTLDEISIWNRSLTSAEITKLYNSGAGLRPTTTTTTSTFTNTYSAGDVVDWNMKFCDSDGDCGQAVSNYRFTIDDGAPTIDLAYPTSLIDYGKINGTLQLNFTATDTNLDKVWYEYILYPRESVTTSKNYTIKRSNENIIFVQKISGAGTPFGSNYTFVLPTNCTNRTDMIIYKDYYVDVDLFNNISCKDSESSKYFLGKIPSPKYGDETFLRISSPIFINGSQSGIYNVSNITLTTKKNVTIYANDTAGNLKVETFGWDYKVFENSRTFNTTTFETKNETFLINLTANSSLTNVYLNYNGIDYLTTKTGDIYSKTLPMELVATDTNRTFYYKFEYAGTNITSISSIQLVKNYLVNWTRTKQYINLTIKDEYDNTIINSTTMDTLFDYYIDAGGYTNIHQEIKVEDGVFGLSSTPNILKWSMFGRLYYYASGYQPRYYFLDDEEVTNTTITQKTLYLLLQTDGILVRYKIYDNIGNEMENVRISAYKIVGSSETLVEQVLTDSLGEASLFLNPNYYHRIVITYDDCTSIDRTRRITSSDTYTEFMTCGAVVGNSELNLTTFENVTHSFSPYSPVQYTNNTVTFSFTSTDSNCNLDETTYILKFGGTNLISLTGNNPCGQTLSQSVNLENYSGTLIGYGIMKIGNSQITLTKQYKVLNINNVLYNQTSVNSLLDKLKDPTFGLEIGFTPTTKAFICFLILFGLIASFGNLTNKDNIPIMLVLVCLFLFVCSYMNFLTVFNSEYDWLNQYGILFLMGIFSSGIIIRRYA